MAKGNIAKDAVIRKLSAAFGTDFLGIVDKKVYVQAPEGGEMVQVAITLTCPKTPVAAPAQPARTQDVAIHSGGGISFVDAVKPEPKIIPQEELNLVAEMMSNLGLGE